MSRSFVLLAKVSLLVNFSFNLVNSSMMFEDIMFF